MKLDQLQYFVETARRQHIGQAARFLNISPSAISHSISSLEEEFGQVLFEKLGRQIKLTHHGKMLLDRADFLLTEVGRIKEELSSSEVELKGHYRIAATHSLCTSFLTPSWMSIQKEHPGLTASLMSIKSGDVLARVNAGEVDLGFCLSPNSNPNIEQEILYEGKLLIAFGKKHPFFKNPSVEDLNLHPYIAAITAQGMDNCENHPAFQKLRINPKVVNLFDNYDTAIAMLKVSNAWSLLPEFVIKQNEAHVKAFVPRGWEANYRIAAIWPKYRIRTTALDQVVDKVSLMLKNLVAGK